MTAVPAPFTLCFTAGPSDCSSLQGGLPMAGILQRILILLIVGLT